MAAYITAKEIELRKKAHISLARYLMNKDDSYGLLVHRKSFFVGSILLDCMPTFLTRRHTISQTFPVLKKELVKLIEDYDAQKGVNIYYCRHLGIITHYIADYFTFPHNEVFKGGFRQHNSYEELQKRFIKHYLESGEADVARIDHPELKSADDILTFIKQAHDKYINVAKEVINDCMYIVGICCVVVESILAIFMSKEADLCFL